jgi:hypothetical protein
VDQLQVCPNYSKLPDSFSFTPIKKFHEPSDVEKIKNFYINDGLTSREISAKMGICKTTVLKRLKELAVSTQPKSHRGKPPFGFSYHAGNLVINTAEAKICSEISKLRSKAKPTSYREIAKLFQLKQLKRRSGSTKWDHDSIRKIFNYWTQNSQEKKK